jgi:hypothetical protein
MRLELARGDAVELTPQGGVGATRPAEAGCAMLSGQLGCPSFRPDGHKRFGHTSSPGTRCRTIASEGSRGLPHQSGELSGGRLFEWGTFLPDGTKTSGNPDPQVHSSSLG